MSRIGNLIRKAQAYKGQEFKQGRMFVPSGMIVPETAKNTMARQLYQAGIITKDDYEKMLGVVYDSDAQDFKEDFSDEAFSTYDDEFKLSELSEYYDDYYEPAGSEPAAHDDSTPSDAQGAQDVSEAQGRRAEENVRNTDVSEKIDGKESKS